MSSWKYRAPTAIIFFAIAAMLGYSDSSRGQEEEKPEESRLQTADGLRLNYLWFAGGKGQKSDAVLLVPNYGTEVAKSPGWTTLAKGLQKQGFSVLLFDFRGHGKSADTRTMDKPDLFCAQSYNRYAGVALNVKTIKEIKVKAFSPNYYPYLVNDLNAARRQIDVKNDASECNSGRVFVVAESGICPLVMLWMSTEFARYGFGPKTKLEEPPRTSAGGDLCGVMFLSWSQVGLPSGAQTALNVANKVMADKELGSDSLTIFSQLKKKVAMAFIYGKEDRGSAAEARTWFNKFVGVGNKTEDAELVKYILEVGGAEKLSGIKLLDIMEKQKDAEEKTSYLENKIIEFIQKTKVKAISGDTWKEKKMENLDPIPVPLDYWGLKPPPK